MSVFQKAYEAECVKNSKLESENRRLIGESEGYRLNRNELEKENHRLREAGIKFHDYYKAHGIIDCGCSYSFQEGDTFCEFKSALHPTDTKTGGSK